MQHLGAGVLLDLNVSAEESLCCRAALRRWDSSAQIMWEFYPLLCVSLPVCVVALLPVISWPMDSIRAQVSHQGKLWKYARILQGPAGHNRLTEERESIKNQNLSCTACKVWLAYVLAFLFLESCFSSNFADEASLATVRSVKVVWNLLRPCRDIFEVWK